MDRTTNDSKLKNQEFSHEHSDNIFCAKGTIIQSEKKNQKRFSKTENIQKENRYFERKNFKKKFTKNVNSNKHFIQANPHFHI